MTQWEKLFGTPEKVAITFATINEWQDKRIRLSSPPEEGGVWYAPGMGYLLGESIGENFGESPLAILEWLESEVRDD